MKFVDSPDKLPKDASIWLYGAGGRGHEFLECVARSRPDVHVHGFIDSHTSGECAGLPKVRLADYVHTPGTLIVICSAFSREIRVGLHKRGIQEHVTYVLDGPHVVGVVDVTGRCNANCLFCNGVERDPARMLPDWDMEFFGRALDQLHHAKEIVFSSGGGEPLLHPELGQMLEACKARGKRTDFFTNGAALRPGERLGRVADATDKIILSFVSPRRDVQLRYMSGVDPERVRQNLLHLSGRHRPPAVSMNVLVMRENATHLDEIIEFAHQTGVAEVVLTKMRQERVEELSDVVLDAMSESERQALQEAAKQAASQAKSLGVNLHVTLNVEHTCTGGEADESFIDTGPRTRVCQLPWTSHFIYHEGTLSPCCYRSHNLGSLKEPDTLGARGAGGFNGQAHSRLQQQLLRGELAGACTTCTLYPMGTLDELAEVLGDKGVLIPGFNTPPIMSDDVC